MGHCLHAPSTLLFLCNSVHIHAGNLPGQVAQWFYARAPSACCTRSAVNGALRNRTPVRLSMAFEIAGITADTDNSPTGNGVSPLRMTSMSICGMADMRSTG